MAAVVSLTISNKKNPGIMMRFFPNKRSVGVDTNDIIIFYDYVILPRNHQNMALLQRARRAQSCLQGKLFRSVFRVAIRAGVRYLRDLLGQGQHNEGRIKMLV